MKQLLVMVWFLAMFLPLSGASQCTRQQDSNLARLLEARTVYLDFSERFETPFQGEKEAVGRAKYKESLTRKVRGRLEKWCREGMWCWELVVERDLADVVVVFDRSEGRVEPWQVPKGVSGIYKDRTRYFYVVRVELRDGGVLYEHSRYCIVGEYGWCPQDQVESALDEMRKCLREYADRTPAPPTSPPQR